MSKQLACQNVLTAMLNEALSQGIIGLTDGDNYKLSAPGQANAYGAEARFDFDFADHKFEGLIVDVSAGELRVIAYSCNSKADQEKTPLGCVPHSLPDGLDAVFAGWLVRRDPQGADLGGHPRRYVAVLKLDSNSSCRNSVPWRDFAKAVVMPGHDFTVEG